MVSLSDIAKIKKGEIFIEVRGEKLPCKGLSARQINTILRTFPAIDKMFGGEVSEDLKLTAASIIETVPEAMGVIAAMGTYAEGDKEQAEAFMELEIHEQIRILSKILEITFGEHWDPLVLKAKTWLGNKLGDEEDKKGPGDRGTVLDTLSLKQRRNLLRSDTTPEMFGATPQDNSPRTQN